MRLATFASPSGPRAAVLTTDSLVPIADLVPGGPQDMLGVLDAGPALWDQLRAAAGTASRGTPLQGATLLAPIPRPRRDVFCVGWNYSEHFAEGLGLRGAPGSPVGASEPQEIPEFPALFSKQPNCVVGHEAPVWSAEPLSDKLDWEVELAAVIGTSGRDIQEARALDHVFGYTVANDVSVRDVQRRHGGQWFKGKNFDTHCPLGPWIVTADEVGDPNAGEGLRITCRVNGQTKQDSRTKFMVFKLPRLIHEFSLGIKLEPGDVLVTGTPEGVGFARKPPEFLKVGDVVESEIERIGVLRNTIARFEPGR